MLGCKEKSISTFFIFFINIGFDQKAWIKKEKNTFLCSTIFYYYFSVSAANNLSDFGINDRSDFMNFNKFVPIIFKIFL